MEAAFSRSKSQNQDRLDLSRKGSVDEDIRSVVSLLNGCEQFFTTSSCSGRIIVIDGAACSGDVHKQDCVWLLVSHQKCSSEDVMCALSRSSRDAVLKFEPFVLHVRCRRLEDAQLVVRSASTWSHPSHTASFDVSFLFQHSAAVNSGFRNSGITVGRTGKIISAVRSTHGLEVPLSHEGRVLVDDDYVRFLTQTANQKMEENLRRIQRFYQNLQSALSAERLAVPDGPSEPRSGRTAGRGASEQNPRSRQREAEGFHGDLDLDDCLDLFT